MAACQRVMTSLGRQAKSQTRPVSRIIKPKSIAMVEGTVRGLMRAVMPPMATQGISISSDHHCSRSGVARNFASLVLVGKKAPKATKPAKVAAASPGILSTIDLGRTVSEDEYKKELPRLQERLSKLAWEGKRKGVSSVVVFEGSDAAGKGGAIRRVTWALDARLYRVIPIAAPTDEERAHHYLWRFWRHVPPGGSFTIYDRSWYGRVLVERVEGFAKEEEWKRAYLEINDFEAQLVESGIALSKLWLHISPDEQLRRFREREQVEWKKHKITDEDWRNREKWDAYETAIDEMVSRTSTHDAPWTLVSATDKKAARLTVLATLCDRLEEAL